MKITDNSPIDQPCIGVLIEEKCAVGQFTDNCIYLIAEPESSMAQSAINIMNGFKQSMNKDDYFNSYELEVIPSVELKNHPKIKERVEGHGDNIIIQLFSPVVDGKRFIVAKTDEDQLFMNIGLIMYAAERVAKFDMGQILKALAIEDPDELTALVRNATSSKKFWSNYFAKLAESFKNPSFGMAASTSSIKERLNIDGIITHQRQKESFESMLNNLHKLRKHPDPKIEAELDLVFNSIDPATWKLFFLNQSPKLQEKMNDFVNPFRLAQASTVDLEVCKANSADKNRKNDGRYRLYIRREEERLMVHFTRKAGFILYLIYLIDRKKNGDMVDTLNITQYKQLFSKLYEMTYGISGETIFTDMIKNFNVNNEVQQKGLYIVLKSIRDDVGMACERMQEPADPFLLKDTTSHLTVLPEHIIIPPEIMSLI